MTAPDYETNAERVSVHFAVDGFLSTVNALLETDRVGSDESRRLGLLFEAVGDLASAVGRGHVDVDTELMMVGACAQNWLEANMRKRRAA